MSTGTVSTLSVIKKLLLEDSKPILTFVYKYCNWVSQLYLLVSARRDNGKNLRIVKIIYKWTNIDQIFYVKFIATHTAAEQSADYFYFRIFTRCDHQEFITKLWLVWAEKLRQLPISPMTKGQNDWCWNAMNIAFNQSINLSSSELYHDGSFLTKKKLFWSRFKI